MVVISILIVIVCGLLALFVLAQNPKGGGLAAGFTGAQQIGGVQRTADFLEKGTWTLAGALIVLCLVSAGIQSQPTAVDELDTPTEAITSGDVNPEDVTEAPAEEGTGEEVPPADAP